MSLRSPRLITALAFAGLAAVGLAGCATPPSAADGNSGENADFVACMVSDFGGFNDKGFNQAVLAGLDTAEKEYGVRTVRLESKSENDYGPNLDQSVSQGCDFTITVGFSLAEATKAAAEKNRDSNFAIIDDASIDLPNVKPVVFDTAQASFLAGYLAAGHSQTGVVAAFGGQPFPPVLLFLDGYADGIAHYNEQNGTDVRLLGWDKASQEGTFSGSFVDIAAGKALTQTFIDQGADVVMPVAGSLYQGSIEAIRDSGQDVALIGVDNDIVAIAPEQADVVLTSVMKQMADAVVELIGEAVADDFSAESYVGDLANAGVTIAPFHDFADQVSPELVAELDALRQSIIDGDIVVQSDNSPR
ncbi:nucleoside-binding protein [Stackebrandtia endophytica]|uniref:Nucleoside-binding protein n=1 Tax=Stackebrandtia endophytica TaxID=1496996 RepID=A0A543AQA4_9ACTN|nr:BMP family ABC transporter substrate-binding protein [Stackebrandtia endophytica]TQL74748.1 nucleoside-binding protein [Stackebrandtia endophytica]